MCNVIDLETQNNLQYVFFPVSSSALRFKVKAANDAHIGLTNGNLERDPMTELHFGGWGNTKSSVRRNRRKPDKVEVNTPGILNRDVYVGFWVRWYDNYIATGFEGSEIPFMAYKDPEPHKIDHVAVRTGWGATGLWKIEVSPVMFKQLTPKPMGGELHWVRMTRDDKIPLGALVGGYEKGELLYVGRAMYLNFMRPGKYVPSTKFLLTTFQNIIQKTHTFEILCGYNFEWVKMAEDALPPNAFPGGFSLDGNNEKLYIGRASIENSLVPGEIHLQSKVCSICYGIPETPKKLQNFEVLVVPENMPEQLTWHAPRRSRMTLIMTGRLHGLPRQAPWHLDAF